METRKGTLYYFTNAYPYGIGESWKRNELSVFSKYFHKITVVPMRYDGNTIPTALPANVTAEKPVYDNPVVGMDYVRFLISMPFSALFLIFMKEFFSSQVFLSRLRFKEWFVTSFMISRLYRHPVFESLRRRPSQNTVLYFFWGSGLSQSVVFLNPGAYGKVVLRYHGIDLYEERHPSRYIPYRRIQLQRADLNAVISEQGKRYLQQKYGALASACEVYRLGCLSEGLAVSGDGSVLNIISCSTLIPLKRVHLIAGALRHLKFSVRWKHIGDGPERERIERAVSTLQPGITVVFTGTVAPSELMKHYVGQPVDLFLNVSESEGVPVSVMEAFSAGVPVIATDVGGTSEIVGDETGQLLPGNLTEEMLASAITTFYHLTPAARQELRNNAYNQYQRMCSAESWAEKMADYLAKNR